MTARADYNGSEFQVVLIAVCALLVERLSMIGKTLGHYQITEKLGEGGMGVVYKARDAHLDRFVAIKVLPAEKVTDPERKRRFVQEAKAASALNHPSIIHVYDIDQSDGTDFIAMECVVGKTLDELIRRKGLRLSLALKYAVQISDALAKAHSTGIVHRDLKPTNIMVNEDGLVKVLDFGLAKLTEQIQGDESASTATIDAEGRPLTEEGVIIGTVAYMSPEQAEGRKVDARSDIFSLGSVLYEMVTGQKAFQGTTRMSTLSAILHQEQKAVSGIAPAIPSDLEKLINRCLRKDPAKRFQHMDDVQVALQELKEESDSGAPAATAPRPGRRRVLPWAAAFVIVLAAGATTWFLVRRSPPADTVRVETLGAAGGVKWGPALSPDGRQLAFVWNGEKQDNEDIYVQLVDEPAPRRLTSDPAFDYSPVWSPDGLRIAFVRDTPAGTEILTVPAAGGTERRVHLSLARCRFGASVMARQFCGLAWSPDGNFLSIVDRESPQAPSSVFLLDLATRVRRKLTTPPPGWYGDGLSAFSPDGRTLAFARSNITYASEIYTLAIGQDGTPRAEPRPLTHDISVITGFDWTADGRAIVYASARGGVPGLWRIAASGGEPQRLAVGSENANWPSVARRGNRLAYTQAITDINIWRVGAPGASVGDPEAAPLRLTHSPLLDMGPAFSPDGKKVVYVSSATGDSEIWTCAGDGSRPARISDFQGKCGALGPGWSPDGRQICFRGGNISSTPTAFEIFAMDVEGGQPRRVTTGGGSKGCCTWSHDGKWIYFTAGGTVWKEPAAGGTPVALARKAMRPVFESFDGKHVYYSGPDRSIWKAPVAGGEATPVRKIGRRAAWTISASGIYVLDPDATGGPSIEYSPFEGSRPAATVKLGGEPEAYVWGTAVISVSPDARWIVYEHRDRYEANLMLAENFR